MASSTVLKPGETIRPFVDETLVSELISRIFGLKVISSKALNSYDDRNYFIKVAPHDVNNSYIPTTSNDGYVLKILNFLDSQNEEIVESQNHVMLHLKSKGFTVPEPVANISGKLQTKEDFASKDSQEKRGCVVRLLTYLPYSILFEVPYTKELMFEAGELASGMQLALKDLKSEALKKRDTLWRLESVPKLRNFLYAVKETEKAQMFQEVLDSWDSIVVPKIPSLEKGFIHGDINEQNLLVKKSEKDSSYHIEGIIDFGDVSQSCYVFDLSIVIMYMMVESVAIHVNDVGGYVISGYCQHRALSLEEWQILKVCVAGRFCQSLILGAYTYLNDPGNEYLLTTAEKGWKAFEKFWKTPEHNLITRWKNIYEKNK